eukprot:TRINITY_DN11461_c0_g1_i1.p1 TRINITY_DN11461_c0_g1~~TRINITY_DN11461_c0_g1_i1.p1  ORF type:complete len:182 (-),score=22.63 TRINITY_DN11461_c0_g1_i1:302-847(-)
MMATQSVQLMARQSLIGYNYSLLGNYPDEPLRTSPDYFTTILFRRLFGNRVLALQHSATSSSLLRSYAFCSREHTAAGGVALALVNLDEQNSLTLKVGLPGPCELYALQPYWAGETATSRDMVSSRWITLNGGTGPLSVDQSTGALPEMLPVHTMHPKLTLPSLTILFAVFPQASYPACVA